jgi:Family of unknown function (DUF6492)
MLIEVRQAILPLALRRHAERWDDLGRARLLIESLARHWRDPAPFKLLVVAPPRDVDTLRSNLPRFANIDLSIRSEGDFFRPFSGFYFMHGWHRQQIIKLHVPVVLGFAGYLTLDADVCCVGDFDATSFVSDGRALSQWAYKYRHDWWRQVAKAVGSRHDPADRGLAVTPNILHGVLAAQALENFRIGLLSPTVVLSAWLMRRLRSVPWTEYSIYTCVAERNGNLFDYHVPWSDSNDTPLLSYSHSIWHPSQCDRLALYTPSSRPDAPFVVLQSSTGVSLALVKEAIDRLAAPGA